MKPSLLLSLFFILSLIFISYADSPPSRTNLYKIVCKDAGQLNATDPYLNTHRCLKLLEAYPQITSAKDYVTLCKFVLEIVIEKLTKGQNYLK